MAHLLFLPRAAGRSCWFLWGIGPADGHREAVSRLAAVATRTRVDVVTERLRPEPVEGLEIPLLEGLSELARLEADRLAHAPASLAAWSLASKFALDLVARERVVPHVGPGPRGLDAAWGVSLAAPEDADRFRRLARALPLAAHAVPGPAPEPRPRARPGARRRDPRPPARDAATVAAPDALLGAFLDAAADTLVRRGSARVPSPAPDSPRRWEARLVAALTGPAAHAEVGPAGWLERDLLDELVAWAEPVRGALATDVPRLCLRLDAPPPAGPARETAPWRLCYFLQAADDPSLLLPAERVWASAATRVAWMERSFVAPQETLLRRLGEVARIFPPVARSLDDARPWCAELSDAEAGLFLAEAGPLLRETGATVLLPAELTAGGQRRLRLRLRVGARRGATGAVAGAAGLSLAELAEYRFEVALGDRALSAAEFRDLTRLKRPLVRWRDQWVLLDPGEVADVERLLRHGLDRSLTLGDALAAGLRGTLAGEDAARVPIEVAPEGGLGALVDRLRAGVEPCALPPDLAGALRPYQARGLAWLSLMAELGLGGCLADDMGLGKTIQLIAFLLARRARRPDDPRPSLVVCPTSVVGNWERELARFAPSLPVLRHHGAGRARAPEALRDAPPHAVVLTTYAVLRRDADLLGAVEWTVAALDEAQNVKNPAARQAQVARSLAAAHRFALTGTPVENRLAELWSILQFCVPGLLGPLERFRRLYAVPVERYRDEAAAERLRRVVRPFVLRRVKSDPAIVAELPPKQEIPVTCTLTAEQATLYQAALDEALAHIERAEGVRRRGLVLALLTALKQICNHPAHYLREPGPLPGRSGKLDRLGEMLEETVAAGDRALVFTQFREMGERLARHLERVLGVPPLFLHGGVPRAARDEMVRRFQEEPEGPPVFVLSLKAGGTGLNLTRASRVFHFDRWWNPAVEDQATDRAHRIGQRRVVQVYRLLAAGTVEERIDAILAAKRALAGRVVGAGEAWITELSDGELRGLLALSEDAVAGAAADADAEERDGDGGPTPAGGIAGRGR